MSKIYFPSPCIRRLLTAWLLHFLSLSLCSLSLRVGHFLQSLLNLSYLSCIYVYVLSNSSLFCFTLQRYSAQRAKGTSLPYITVVSSFSLFRFSSHSFLLRSFFVYFFSLLLFLFFLFYIGRGI